MTDDPMKENLTPPPEAIALPPEPPKLPWYRKALLASIQPRAGTAKWLIFAALAGIMTAGMLGHLNPLISYLDAERFSFKVGNATFSAYRILKTLIALVLLLWTVSLVSDLFNRRLQHIRMRASNRLLVGKIVQIFLYVIVFLLLLNLLGINLTALAVFSGALGIGLGLGLQKIASNFISGMILLLERAVEVDDLIELADGTRGFVRNTSARYTLVERADGREVMIPNEDFITARVSNLTFHNSRARIEINLSVSYDSDPGLAIKLMHEAALRNERCIAEPKPLCFLKDFGADGIEISLFFWINDVENGTLVTRGEVLMEIWKVFKEHNIQIPFPQREVRILGWPPLIKGDADGA